MAKLTARRPSVLTALSFAVLGSALLAVSAGMLRAADDPAPLGTLVDVGGYRVHLYCTGAGSPTVVVAGGFSFDWGLIQPKISTLTRICTWDPSGTAWSDPFPARRTPACSDRVAELHEALHRASVSTPVVLVGFSIGALYARLYALRYPEDVAGMVIVDHAFLAPDPPAGKHADTRAFSAQDVDTPPALISQTPIALGIEDDRNFQRLPERDRDLHAWAMSRNPVRPTPEMAAECSAEVGDASSLGAKPLVVISTNNESSGYRQLQARLLGLSRNAKQFIAAHSTHMVIVDEPETVVSAIEEVVKSIREPRAGTQRERGSPQRR
ncbi:MAG TPA: alpha/beta hydrolase [Bryobacteraceae bacterium]|nr:alpha/beta hydrolase [Bryobacteraceae bacterium]